MSFPSKLEDLYYSCFALASCSYTCASKNIQLGFAEWCISGENEKKQYLSDINRICKQALTLSLSYLKNTSLTYIIPNSSWYIYVDYSYYRDKLLKLDISNNNQLAAFLLKEHGIVVVSGISFGDTSDCLRLSIVSLNKENIRWNNDKMIWTHELFEPLEKSMQQFCLFFQQLT